MHESFYGRTLLRELEHARGACPLSGGDIERNMPENADLIDVDSTGSSTFEPKDAPWCKALKPP